MSTYIDSIILFVLCAGFYPFAQPDALQLAGILCILSFYCFELVTQNERFRMYFGILTLLLCFFLPELSVFLPFCCYVFFYHRQYYVPALFLLPCLLYLFRNDSTVWFSFALFTAMGYYLAYHNRTRNQLLETVHTLRDSSVEEKMLLQQNNRRLVEHQNDQIYIATLKERNRIAREIHDNVGHLLSRSILQVGALLAICKDTSIKPHLETLKETLDLAMNNIRNSVHDLHDESIDLSHAMQSLVDNFTFCPVSFQHDISKNVPKNIKYCILSISREALHNVVRHSNATRVSVTLKEHPAFYQLLIEDNGTGNASSTDTSDGMGLINMKERVNALHGILHITQNPGFRIFVTIPKEEP